MCLKFLIVFQIFNCVCNNMSALNDLTIIMGIPAITLGVPTIILGVLAIIIDVSPS